MNEERSRPYLAEEIRQIQAAWHVFLEKKLAELPEGERVAILLVRGHSRICLVCPERSLRGYKLCKKHSDEWHDDFWPKIVKDKE